MKAQNIVVLILAVLLGSAWFVLALMGKTAVEPLVAFIQSSLVSIGAYVLTIAKGPGHGDAGTAGPSAPPGQAGRIRYELLLAGACVAIAMAFVSGCTTTTASMYSGLYTQAKAGVQVFDDNTLATMRDLVCAQPYSAIQRHPELQPGIVALCGPLANTAALDPAQVQQLLGIAKQLGLQPAGAAPATAAAPKDKPL